MSERPIRSYPFVSSSFFGLIKTVHHEYESGGYLCDDDGNYKLNAQGEPIEYEKPSDYRNGNSRHSTYWKWRGAGSSWSWWS